MPLKYPKFDESEYACLNQNLCVVDYALKLEALDREIADHRTELASCTEAVLLQGPAMLRYALEAARECQSPTDFPAACSQRITAYRNALRRNLPPDVAAEKKALGVMMIRAFGEFNEAAFEEFFKATFAEEFTADAMKAKQSAQGRLNASIVKRERLIDEAEKNIFRTGPPKRWKTYVVGDPGMVESILKSFVFDWRSRSILFGDHVTVSGVSIGSLTGGTQKTWWDAFKRLGLDKLAKRPYYACIIAPAASEAFTGLSALRG